MKTFRVTVAVVVLLTFICIQESSAVPLSEVEELEEPMINDNPIVAHDQMSEESWKMPYNRQKRSPAGCKWCCNCCPNQNGCGPCCTYG